MPRHQVPRDRIPLVPSKGVFSETKLESFSRSYLRTKPTMSLTAFMVSVAITCARAAPSEHDGDLAAGDHRRDQPARAVPSPPAACARAAAPGSRSLSATRAVLRTAEVGRTRFRFGIDPPATGAPYDRAISIHALRLP